MDLIGVTVLYILVFLSDPKVQVSNADTRDHHNDKATKNEYQFTCLLNLPQKEWTVCTLKSNKTISINSPALSSN